MYRVIKKTTTAALAMFGCMACLGCNTPAVVDPGGDTSTLAVFTDDATEFETSDVYDADDEIVRFDTTTKSIIWAADDRAFQEGNWDVIGNFLGAAQAFQVRFGNVDGQRRA